jgi:hypothetical protein
MRDGLELPANLSRLTKESQESNPSDILKVVVSVRFGYPFRLFVLDDGAAIRVMLPLMGAPATRTGPMALAGVLTVGAES